MKFRKNKKKLISTQDKKKVRSLYDSVAQKYAQNYLNPTSLFGLEKQQRLKIVRHNIQELQPSSVLDLGCGPGFTTIKIAEDLSNSTVIGLDFSSEMISVASQNNMQRPFFQLGDAENLPYTCEQFSVLFALGLIEKFKNPTDVLNECWRVLIPGGYLFFTYPNKSSFLRLFRKIIESFLENNLATQENVLSIKSMSAISKQAGFKVIKRTYLTYGNSFILFPWSRNFNILMEKYLGNNILGHGISMTSFWSLQKRSQF